jgi:hypothetical protein
LLLVGKGMLEKIGMKKGQEIVEVYLPTDYPEKENILGLEYLRATLIF